LHGTPVLFDDNWHNSLFIRFSLLKNRSPGFHDRPL
jgi:hypothetical protein